MPRPARETFLYVPSPRGCLAWLLDVFVVAAIVALALNLARHRSVRCEWPDRELGRCEEVAVNAIGQTNTRAIEGIHGFAYRARNEVGFVTDARNKDRDAFFGTRAVELWDASSADALQGFATRRGAPSISLEHGPSAPVIVSAALLALLAVYALVTRRAAYALTVDRDAGTLTISPRGRLGESRSYPLSDVRSVSVESTGGGRQRLRVVLASAEPSPITAAYWPGEHHGALAREVQAALE